jgi:alanine-glyoxylate transaminase / serine-glyoxylate transaminase / serine-pyruvate transaminase
VGGRCRFTASQKALGAPPGLGVLLAGPNALAAWKARTTPVASMYLDFAEWLPIHEACEAQKPAYFATPPVNLITALDVSLGQILEEGLAQRIRRHERIAEVMAAGWARLGLEHVPQVGRRSHTLSALYCPEGVDASLVKAVAEQGVVVAGGLHPALKTKYFRVGHMGAVNVNDVTATLGAIESGLASFRK